MALVLIACPAFTVMKAARKCHEKRRYTTRIALSGHCRAKPAGPWNAGIRTGQPLSSLRPASCLGPERRRLVASSTLTPIAAATGAPASSPRKRFFSQEAKSARTCGRSKPEPPGTAACCAARQRHRLKLRRAGYARPDQALKAPDPLTTDTTRSQQNGPKLWKWHGERWRLDACRETTSKKSSGAVRGKSRQRVSSSSGARIGRITYGNERLGKNN